MTEKTFPFHGSKASSTPTQYMAEQNSTTSQIHSYHCLCTTLVLTTVHDLQSLPHRSTPLRDSAVILPPPFETHRGEEFSIQDSQTVPSILLNVDTDRKPVIIQRDDGFEKRTLLRCGRCRLVIGYNLDEAHFENQPGQSRPMYLLPGGMATTADMAKGVKPGTPSWSQVSH